MKQEQVMSYIPVAILVACLGISHAAVAYEQPTHKELTGVAAARSELPGGVLRDLGLVDLKSQLNGKSVLEWMRYGADFEDSKIPYSNFKFRFLNHFYNPLNGEGFSDPELPKFASTGLPSPSWGLEDQGDIDGQDYSLKDGYQWLLNGLTLPNKSDREVYLAKTFRTLGHVVHLIQDAGQPQHTRNDDHWYESLYETISNDEMKKAITNPGNFYGDYPIVQLSKARDYFHTLPSGASNVLQGKGLAEYTNRGFVTTRTNFSGSLGGGSSEFPISTFINDPRFPTPNGNGVIISTLNIHDPSLLGNTKLNLQGDISFVGTNVIDTYDPSRTQPNPRTSSYSVFDADLEKYNLGAKFTYNRFNAKEAHKFLIPRAVSYSAGLINWFFRGKIDIVKDPANASQYLIKNLGTEPLQGTFTLYYDDTSDVRKTVTGAQWNTASYTPDNQLAAGATITVPAFMPPFDAKAANKYMLVFKGKIGADITNPAATDSVAAKIVTNTRIKQLAAGYGHTCAMIVDGTVMCWGLNNYGQLGNGTTTNSATPVSVLGLGTATSVALGWHHTCATLADGAVKCWGLNGYGALGNGVSGYDANGNWTDPYAYSATPVSVLDVSTATSVAAGGYHTCATLADGGVQCWGWNTFGTLGNGISSVDANGNIVPPFAHSATPVSVLGVSTATSVAAGGNHTCATLVDGAVQCWGWNGYGVLGNSISSVDANGNLVPPYAHSATPVNVLGVSTATLVAAGLEHTCAMLAHGSVQCWGWNAFGALGNGVSSMDANGNIVPPFAHSATPVSVLDVSTATSVAAGSYHTCATLADGAVQCWGWNAFGALGNGVSSVAANGNIVPPFAHSATPVSVLGVSTATSVAAGGYHTCATLVDGAVQCWGGNGSGELGNGTTTQSSTPVTVIGLPGSP